MLVHGQPTGRDRLTATCFGQMSQLLQYLDSAQNPSMSEMAWFRQLACLERIPSFKPPSIESRGITCNRPWQQQQSSDHDQTCVAYGHRLPPCPDASCSFRSRIANCSARIAASLSSAVRSRRAASLRMLDRCCSNSSLTAHSITYAPLKHYSVIGPVANLFAEFNGSLPNFV